MALHARLGLLVIPFADVAGDAEVPLIEHRRVLDALDDVAPRRTTACQINVHIRRVGINRRLRVAGGAIAPGLVVLLVTAGASSFDPERRVPGMAGGTGQFGVPAVIEGQGAIPLHIIRELKRDETPHRLRRDLLGGVASLAGSEAHVHVVAVGAPGAIGDRRRIPGAVALRALEAGVLFVLEAGEVRLLSP